MNSWFRFFWCHNQVIWKDVCFYFSQFWWFISFHFHQNRNRVHVHLPRTWRRWKLQLMPYVLTWTTLKPQVELTTCFHASSDCFPCLSLSQSLLLFNQNQHSHIQNLQSKLSAPKKFPKNSQNSQKNSQKIPKKFPKNSQKIQEFPKNSQIIPKILKISSTDINIMEDSY